MSNASPKALIIGAAVLVAAGLSFNALRHASADQTAAPATVPAAAPAAVPAVKLADNDSKGSSSSDFAKAAQDAMNGDSGNSDSSAKDKDAAPAPAKEAAPAASTDSGKKPEASSSSADDKSGSLLNAPSSLEVDVDKAMAERSMGKDDAPVTMIEYASLTCPHCAHFENDLFPEIKRQLIDTGKVRYIYRDYPLDKYAQNAALMARCADPDQYFNLIETIFKNQDRWVHKDDPMKGLMQLGGLAGMSEEYINACIKNEELQSALLAKVQEGQKNYKINATPTFVFNNGTEIMSGDKEVGDFVATVNRLMGK